MKIDKVVTVALDKEEIDLFAKALECLNCISEWGEAHLADLPEPAKPLVDKAEHVYFELRDFLNWMCVDTDEIEDNFGFGIWKFNTRVQPSPFYIRYSTSNLSRPSNGLTIETPFNIKNIFQFKSF